MQLTHLGHSCLLVQAGGARVLIDPGTFSDVDTVTGLDAILVTHQHPDHCDPDRIGALVGRNPGAVLRTDPGTADLLRPTGLDVTVNEAGRGFAIDDVEITPVGHRHAEIHPYVDRIDNLGLVLTADGTTLFHPGDALDADPGRPVDVLAVPVNAPWCAVKETIAFCRRIAPQVAVPIHDALLRPAGRTTYLTHIGGYGTPGGLEVCDLTASGPTRF